MTLDEWAAKWAVPPEAIRELCLTAVHASDVDDSVSHTSDSEARVQSEIRLEAAGLGVYLFRNNNGAGKLASGNFVRFGLGNDSAKVNEKLKSGDLIGVRRLLITPAHVGTYIGQFVSRECKRRDWRFSGTIEEQAQARWAALVIAQGGDAKIVQGAGSFA